MFGAIVRRKDYSRGAADAWQDLSGEFFERMSSPFEAGRYHSLCAEDKSLPTELVVTAQTARGEIMGVRHQTLALEGVQFHPESILTPEGDRLMENFMRMQIDA